MEQRFVKPFDIAGRKIQTLLGPDFTRYAQKRLGKRGTRFIREILGRSPRHRVQCRCNTQKLGSGDASWIICPDLLSRDSIVYSLGVGNDITFDLELIEKFGVNVFAFDPTSSAVNWIRSQHTPKEFHFFDHGVSNFDGIADFYHLGGQFTTNNATDSNKSIQFEVCRLKTIMARLGHGKIHLLKMDIEGEEYAVIQDMIRSKLSVDQLTAEFHHRFSGIGARKTEDAIKLLNQNGYQIFDISDSGREYSLIKV